MRILVTGASGWIGSASARELVAAGHDVVGLARSDAAAEAIAAAGLEVARGDIDDLDSVRSAAESCEGVVHMAYKHDFSRMEDAAHSDRRVIDVVGSVLEGSGGPFVIASGVAGLTPGRPATERDQPDPDTHPRVANAAATLALADRGVRSSVVRFAPTVHGDGDHGFMAVLVAIAREKGVSGYIGDGANRWPAVHRLDAAALVRLAAEKAPAGTVVHAISEEGVATRDIAEAIGRHLDLPVVSIPSAEAGDHFSWLGQFFAMDVPASSLLTRELLGWTPTQPGLIEDLDQGHYFRRAD